MLKIFIFYFIFRGKREKQIRKEKMECCTTNSNAKGMDGKWFIIGVIVILALIIAFKFITK